MCLINNGGLTQRGVAPFNNNKDSADQTYLISTNTICRHTYFASYLHHCASLWIWANSWHWWWNLHLYCTPLHMQTDFSLNASSSVCLIRLWPKIYIFTPWTYFSTCTYVSSICTLLILPTGTSGHISHFLFHQYIDLHSQWCALVEPLQPVNLTVMVVEITASKTWWLNLPSHVFNFS